MEKPGDMSLRVPFLCMVQRKKLALIILSLLVGFPLWAQDAKAEYEKFRKQAFNQYDHFRKRCNEEYASFMKQAWEHFSAAPCIPKPPKDTLPSFVYDGEQISSLEKTPVIAQRIAPVPELQPRPYPTASVERRELGETFPFVFTFYGTRLSLEVNQSLKFKLISTGRDDVAEAWRNLSSGLFDNLVIECLKLRNEYHLCDWAYLQMILSFSDHFLSVSNESILLTAYIFSQSGYMMRLGLTKGSLTLLFGSRYQMFDIPFFRIGGVYFYQINGKDGEMDIVNYSFPDEKCLSFAVTETPVFADSDESERRDLKSPSGVGKIGYCVNNNLLKFFSMYPSVRIGDDDLTRWTTYVNAPLSPSLEAQLYPALKSAVAGKSEKDAVSMLMKWIQNSFKEKDDTEIWGRRRIFFAEEMMHYPYSDNEDRVVLFSRLVRDLVGLDVILVSYPSHLSLAVKFNEDVPGECFDVCGKRYTVCDLSYLNAPVGVVVPGMDPSQAELIMVKK